MANFTKRSYLFDARIPEDAEFIAEMNRYSGKRLGSRLRRLLILGLEYGSRVLLESFKGERVSNEAGIGGVWYHIPSILLMNGSEDSRMFGYLKLSPDCPFEAEAIRLSEREGKTGIVLRNLLLMGYRSEKQILGVLSGEMSDWEPKKRKQRTPKAEPAEKSGSGEPSRKDVFESVKAHASEGTVPDEVSTPENPVPVAADKNLNRLRGLM